MGSYGVYIGACFRSHGYPSPGGSSWRPKSCQWWRSPPMHVCAWLDLWLATGRIGSTVFFYHGNFYRILGEQKKVHERSHYTRIKQLLESIWWFKSWLVYNLVLLVCLKFTYIVRFLQANLRVTIRQIAKNDKEKSINHQSWPHSQQRGRPLHHLGMMC